MALKQHAGQPAKIETAVETAEVQPSPVLELALYKLYTWQGNTYERGKPYRFTYHDAMQLLSEQDHGRAVWRMYQPPVKRVAPKEEIVDATRVRAEVPDPDLPYLVGRPAAAGKRIDVGSDDEIQDILNQQTDDGNVTV